ncbi:DUF1674-domain-containing protein [Clathrospora elynae]|uniref:Succinate dehydrogenase assembly factor 4, mitochondrial n=1 Tax=Clathrospora elynae TaxID=706981 RepID=A0A6A5SGI3_9PLEO|nr:DUF1674-domain-containing protein [Clathrospora elynae]
MMATTMRRTLQTLPRQLSRSTRPFSISTPHLAQSPFGSGPAPPRLPKEEQELFEKLQRQSTGAFSTPRSEEGETPNVRMQVNVDVNQSPDSTPTSSTISPQLAGSGRMQINQSPHSSVDGSSLGEGGIEVKFENGKAIKKGEEFHPNMRRGAPPEFEGDVNPKTGEVGGPKNEPLRWGGSADWSYNGRVTDF